MPVNRIPPHDEEAEEAVLGAMLTDKESVTASFEVLKPENFYRDDNKTIFQACFNIYNNGEPIDIITVSNELTKMGKLDSVGGYEYLAKLPESVPTTANVDKYITIVEEKALLRGLISTANGLVELGYDQNEEVGNIMDKAQQDIFNLIQQKSQKGYSTIKEILIDSFQEMQELYNKKQKITGVPTGFIDLDRMIGGLHKSDLIFVAARPAMGKTAFALNIATNAVMKGGISALIFSLEMSKKQCANRILSSQALVDSMKMSRGELQDEDWSKLAFASSQLSDSTGIYIDDTTSGIAEIRAKCRKLKLEDEKLGLVVIDYLQLVSGNQRRSGSREQEVSEISRSLKLMAKELDVPIIALSQLSRAPEARENHRPMLQDLRESGSIEQDADMVMFIYRDDYYKPELPPTNEAEIIIAKNRSGTIGTVHLAWMGQYTRFENLLREYH